MVYVSITVSHLSRLPFLCEEIPIFSHELFDVCTTCVSRFIPQSILTWSSRTAITKIDIEPFTPKSFIYGNEATRASAMHEKKNCFTLMHSHATAVDCRAFHRRVINPSRPCESLITLARWPRLGGAGRAHVHR